MMAAWPKGDSGTARFIREWLTANRAFRQYVLGELKNRGPLRSRDLDDRARIPWQSSGWTHERNVSQMLEFLQARGEVSVVRREGDERTWDVAERAMTINVPTIPPKKPGASSPGGAYDLSASRDSRLSGQSERRSRSTE